jgi:hypothetical protein
VVVEGRLRDADVFADDTAEITCEGAALTTFNATKTAGCGACTNTTAISTAVEELTDANNNQVYCAPGTPFGGDDSGNIPSDALVGQECENRTNKAVGALVGSLLKCHASRSGGKLDEDSEESCELAARTKVFSPNTHVRHCDACEYFFLLYPSVESQVDALNTGIYCASPSGAFVPIGPDRPSPWAAGPSPVGPRG